MRIRLTHRYMMKDAGSIMDVRPDIAARLIRHKRAEAIVEEEKSEPQMKDKSIASPKKKTARRKSKG